MDRVNGCHKCGRDVSVDDPLNTAREHGLWVRTLSSSVIAKAETGNNNLRSEESVYSRPRAKLKYKTLKFTMCLKELLRLLEDFMPRAPTGVSSIS